MKAMKKLIGILCFVTAVAMCIHIVGSDAFAAEESCGWRAKYDTVMMWVNFIIFAFIIVKFGKGPIMNFLGSRKEELAAEIGKLETEKAEAITRTKETQKKIQEGDAYIQKLKSRIAEQGKREKEKLISQAKEQSRYMLEDAKQRAQNQIVQARRSFRSELIDEAIALAMKKMPKEITDKDDQALLENYLVSVK